MKLNTTGSRQTIQTKTTRASALVARIALLGLGIALAMPATAQTSGQSSGVQLPSSMGSMGDSITAGALAGYKRQNSWMPWVEASFLLHVLEYKTQNDYHKIEFRNLSWAAGLDTGANMISHARRLITLQGKGDGGVKVMNAGVSGSVVDDVVNDQWPRLRDWSRKTLGQEAPDYITLLIGANDICADTNEGMTSNADYERKLSFVVDEITRTSPKTRILISALPNIEKLRSIAMNASNNVPTMRTCQDVWKAFSLCPNLTLDADPEHRAAMAQRIKDYNNIMLDVAAKVNAQLVDNDRVRVSGGIYNKDFTPDDISMDCFHPNPNGQYKLSRETWASTWWGPMFNESKDVALRKKAKNAAFCRRGSMSGSGLPRCED